ncbi:MAG: VCBS repeat-containing protein, partial [Candidatus Aminicenantes bacterium]|nr:VCBS repeat-containing protein [Candidatus Aminicenantes bacterium]
MVSPANGVSGQTPPVNLQWQDTNTSPQESGYNVRIRPSGGAYSYYSAAANVTFYAPPGLLAGRTYSWNVQAVGNGTITNDSAWANGGADWAFTTAAGETISTPNGPSGPTTGSKHTSYTYTTGGSTTSLGHAVQYWIDWGDGGGTGWLAAGTTSADHAWTADGTFLVKAKSRCAVDPALESPWSTALSVQIGSGRRVLIVDLDKNLNSGPALKSAVEANGKATLYQTTWPSSIEVSAYDAVFACLGVYPNNHALTSAEGAALKTYLDGGGRLYLEGGDTWAYDPQTTVHSYFGISGLSDGGQDTGSVTGSGIMAGRSFSYAGDNNWMDRLDVAPGAAGASVIWDNQSPAYHNGILRSGSNFRTIGVSFEFGGIPAASRNSVMGGYLAFLEGVSTSGGKRVFGDFGPLGIWVWDNTSWTLLNDSNPEAIVPANTDGDTDDELFLDLGASGLWLWNGGSLGPLTTDNPEADVAGDFDGDGQDEAAADFGAKGLWLWNSSGWSQLSTENAEGIVAGNGDSDAADEAVADFGTKGLFLWNSGIWTLLSSDNAEGLTAADVDGDGYDEFVADFGTKGLWLWNNGEWLYLTSDNAQDFLGGDFDNDGRDELAVDFGGLGLWLWKNGAWSMLTGDNPQTLAVGQTDEDPMAELTADFGSLGLWQWNGSL